MITFAGMKKFNFDSNIRVGILGGGQLGRMLFVPALELDIELHFLDPNPNSPCLRFCKNQMVGDFNDYQTVLDFGKDKDIISVEIEHVNTGALFELEKQGKAIYPQPEILEIIKDKGKQKTWYQENAIPTSDFYLVDSQKEIKAEFPYVQKLRTGGYDGKGVQVIQSINDIGSHFDAPSVIEEKVDFVMELAVLVARNEQGEVKSYPVVGMDFDHEANLVSYLYSPANVEEVIANKARALAEDLISKLGMIGLLAVEIFLTKDGDLLVNEVAPRPHNSGHHTIEGNITSQYEQHLRSICNLPLGDTDMTSPAVMVNLLGAKDQSGPVIYSGLEEFLQLSGVHFHIYGKLETKPFRKMGHVTVLNDDIDKAIATAKLVKEKVLIGS
ncbi:MAG: 5-(carboxyamino)imidazole ribonucleotide synthase [Patiriisocius sp.]|jgi:5-(carboxyamino)imidazole ribonucleotide synthase